MTALPRFGLNRFDARSVDAFAADVRRAETLGWDGAFQPDSQLRRRDTYVLLAAAARAPARVKELEAATRLMRALLDGEPVEVGAARPARLPHHRPVPIWIAAGGPRTLRMAGGVADGVFIRVGTHPANIATAVEAIRAGAREAGRDPSRVGLGAVF